LPLAEDYKAGEVEEEEHSIEAVYIHKLVLEDNKILRILV
jgi:hypothetical protein